MKKYKIFTFIFIAVISSFVLYNLLVWNFYTKDLIIPQENRSIGDLARMSYYKYANENKYYRIDLPRKHIDYKDYKNQKIDMITIGDSFAQGIVGGYNPYFQDYIATKTGMNVLNIPSKQSVLEYLIILNNKGVLDKIKPKYILLETVERQVGLKFKLEDFNKVVEETKEPHSVLSNSTKLFQFINEANFRCVLYDILYNFSDRAFISEVYIKKTSQPLFSNFGSKILIVSSDIEQMPYNNEENILKTNDNLNKLAKILAEKNIKLIFMPVVDKYNLYYDYIEENNYPKSTFFEQLRPLKKDYIFIDTKQILEKEVKNGIKDIYYKDDTHWSYKAVDAVVSQIQFN